MRYVHSATDSKVNEKKYYKKIHTYLNSWVWACWKSEYTTTKLKMKTKTKPTHIFVIFRKSLCLCERVSNRVLHSIISCSWLQPIKKWIIRLSSSQIHSNSHTVATKSRAHTHIPQTHRHAITPPPSATSKSTHSKSNSEQLNYALILAWNWVWQYAIFLHIEHLYSECTARPQKIMSK